MDPDEVRRGIDIANVFIAYRMRSEFEVRRRLRKTGLAGDVIDAVIEHLSESGLINDRAFAGAYARDHMIGRKRGPVRVRRGLAALGVSESIAAEAVSEVVESLDMSEQALGLARKRWQQLGRIDDLSKRKKRLYDYLVRRGYPYDQVRSVMDEIENES